MNLFKTFYNYIQKKCESQNEYPNIVAAKVVDVQKHPNADRLRVVKVDVGDKIIEPVVCGAFNFETGDIVALALPGAEIKQDIHSPEHKPFILEKAKIRGVESQGMICAAFELGLSKEPGQPARHASQGDAGGGIMVLKSDVEPGSLFTPQMIK